VTRTWFATGALKREVQSTTSGSAPTTNSFGYDAAGRPVWYVIGVPGNTNLSDSITYLYDAGNGDLRWIKVRWRGGTRDSVQLYWDAVGRRDSVIYSNGAKVKFAYDKDGALRLVCGKHTGGPLGDVFNFTQHHIWVDTDGLIRETRGQSVAGCGAAQSPTTVSNSYDTRHELTQQIAGTDTNTYRYDASGNRTLWRWANGSVIVRNDSNYTDPTHNRLVRARVISDPPTLYKGFSYDSTGARLVEQWYQNGQPTNGPGKRFYFYDGLGRPTGTEEFQCTGWDVNGNCSNWSSVPSPTTCSYDPIGRLYSPCENLSPLLGFDGDNVVRTGADSTVTSATWTFVHGPGTDDPLMAHFTTVSPGYTAYIMTDGAGRQFAVGDPAGYDCSKGPTSCGNNYANNGGQYSGGVTNARSFGATRQASSSIYKVSFFRNRFYDQQTGRWTQEDPIGVAGGINLYGYVENNPVTLTDPFGLKVCFQGSPTEVKRLADSTRTATKTTFDLDASGCVTNVQPVGRWTKVSRAFASLANDSTEIVNLVYTSGAGSGNRKGKVEIDTTQVAHPYGTFYVSPVACQSSPGAVYDEPSIIAHELGHAWATFNDNKHTNRIAIDWENTVNIARGRPPRNQLCH